MKSVATRARTVMWRSLLGLFFFLVLPVSAQDALYFNDLDAPRNLEDAVNIEKALKKSLALVRPATVGIQMVDGSGSGVIVSPDGLVLTAAHVSGGIDREMTVIMEDGTEYDAISLGLDSETDAAMIQIQGQTDLPFVELDRENRAEVGDWVFVLAHPGGYDKGRGSVVRLGRLVRQLNGTIQSDPQLIGGDSGGPLFDIEGQLIAINSRVGFTVEESLHAPISEFIGQWDEMLDSEWIGDGPFAKRPEKGQGLLGVLPKDLDDREGVLIGEVTEGSAAERAGVEKGDIFLTINEADLSEMQDLLEFMKGVTPRDIVTVEFERDGEKRSVELKVKERL